MTLPKPFFAMLIALGLHHPYSDLPPHLKVLDMGELESSPVGNYLHSMHYLDTSLKRFFLDLERQGLLDDTIVALYGDHDPNLPFDDTLRQLAGGMAWNPSLPFQFDRIPLFVVLPGKPIHGTNPNVGGHVDIAPTLLDLLGVPRPSSFLGTSLIGPPRTRVAVTVQGRGAEKNLLFMASGDSIPLQGACFAFPSGDSLPRKQCNKLAKRVLEELEVSESVVLHDLVPELAQ